MKMKVISSENSLCSCCMEEHEVKKVRVKEAATFKNRLIKYDAEYYYCDKADEFYMDEQQLQDNDLRLKNAYREAEGLLTSDDISTIRSKYSITQNDLCTLLGWGGKTITRYESHQVQDRAHDTILKKLDGDPEWFLSLLCTAKSSFHDEIYVKYYNAVTKILESNQDLYIRKAIEARYTVYNNLQLHGNVELSLDKVIDVIRYLSASKKVTNLYKVKLMKLLWYIDALSFKKRDFAITGLVYQALPMGAVPVGHDSIINLKGVPCEEVEIGEMSAYHFSLKEETAYPSLSDDDIAIIETVIKKLGKMSKDEIVSFMHKERAYTETEPRDIIMFEYTKELNI